MQGGRSMEGTNLLLGGIDTLNKMKEHIQELEGYKEKNKELQLEEKRYETELNEKKKSLQEELNTTIKKRKEEVMDTFDQEIDRAKEKKKKVKGKRDKLKGAKVSKRIESETAVYYEENRQLKEESKKIFKQNHVPKRYNNKLYYALFLPSSMSDIIVIALFALIFFLVIPCGIYFRLMKESKTIYLAAIYFVIIVVVFGTYIMINNKSKGKYREIILQVKQLRNLQKSNKKKMKATKKAILNDKDESNYGLDKFNEEMKGIEENIADIEQRKKEALANFEEVTKLVISTEIKGKYEEELHQLTSYYDRIHEEINYIDHKIREMSLEMANHYEAFLGKEYMSVEKLDQLIHIMETQNISTISEALKA